MSANGVLDPIPGRSLDPEPKAVAVTAEKLDSRHRLLGLGYRSAMRFGMANASLLAAGTTYYLFLAVFALTALAFGVASMLGAEQIITVVNEALNSMFPGLVGQSGIDPSNLASLGQSTSIIGLVVLLYSGGGAVQAAKISIHQVFGAPKDPRNFVLARLILTGWLLVLAPLVVVSYAPTVAVGFFARPILDFLGLGQGLSWTISGMALLLSFALDFLLIYLLLSTLGGIRPVRVARVVGAMVGAVGFQVLKYLAGEIIAWSVGNPRYGAFAAPVAALFVLYLQCVVLYAAAALAAAYAQQRAQIPQPAQPADGPVDDGPGGPLAK